MVQSTCRDQDIIGGQIKLSDPVSLVEGLLASGVLLVNMCMSGKYSKPVREEALRRFRGNVEDLHRLKHEVGR